MRALENAVVRLLKRRPFYGHLLLGLRRRYATRTGAAGLTVVNGTPTLAVDEAGFSAASGPEQEALLEHLLKHLLHLHPLRRKGRQPHLWDLAADLAINPTIANLPEGAELPALRRLETGLAAEEYYHLLHNRFACGNLSGEGYGSAAASDGGVADTGDGTTPLPRPERHSPLDDHSIWEEAESTPLRLAEEVVRTMVAQAWRSSNGEVPGELIPLVDGWLAPTPIPWGQILRQFVATAGRVGRTSTWQRAHRRFDHTTPGLRQRRRLHLLIGVDVSDSTDQRDLREAFARELLQICRSRESRLTVLYAGSRIQRIDSFSSSTLVTEAYHGGGFTDLRPVFDYARGLQPRPAAVIYLTDGYGPAPEQQEFPTLWVLTAAGTKPTPWGVELRLNA